MRRPPQHPLAFALIFTVWFGTPGRSEAAPATADRKAARAVLHRWLNSQNRRDFEQYKALYAPAFMGVRRSMDREVTLDREGWFADRARMFKKRMKVSISHVEFRDDDGGTLVSFVQRFESGRYADIGNKEIKLEATPAGLLIVREEMKSSELTPEAQLKLDARPLRAWIAAREAAVKQKDPGARWQLDGIDYRFNETDIPNEMDEADVAYVGGTTRGTTCRYAEHRLELRWKGKEAIVGKETLIVEDCCSGPCPGRTPAGWMRQFLSACGDGDPSGFIDARKGIATITHSDEGSRGSETTRGKFRRNAADMDELCRLQVVTYNCPEAFGPDRRATCISVARGENWDFTFLQREKDVIIESVEGTIMN